MRGRLSLSLCFLVGLPCAAWAQTASGPPQAVSYDEQVRPILAAKCFGCHGPRQQQSGLRLDLRQNALRGGDYGVVIVPGHADESKLIQRITGSSAGLQMPPTGPLEPHEIEILRAWIDRGAEMPGRALEGAAAAVRQTSPQVQALVDAIHSRNQAALRNALSHDKMLANACDAAGNTLLMHAAYAGTLASMQALLEAGADVNAANVRKATALHWSVHDVDKVKLLLLKGADVNARTVEGRTALYTAAQLPGGATVVKVLLELGADVDARTILGTTPLFAAAAASTDTVRLLLDKGANVNASSLSGVTPLIASRGSDVAALLISRGADVRMRSKRGESALADAASRGDLAAAKLLLDHGADVNASDYRGYTPLILAAQHDRDAPELVRLLISRGANLSAVAEGHTALTIAERRGKTEVVRILEDAQAASGVRPAALRASAEKALDLLEKTSPTFIKKGGCNSCHNQMLPAAAQALARARGIAVGETLAQLPSDVSEASTERYVEYSVGGGAGVTALGFDLFAKALAQEPSDDRMHAEIHFIKGMQQSEGNWRGGGSRPPLTFDDFTPTAYMIHALNAYAPPAEAEDTAARIAKARAWLMNAKADRTQERAFRLLGLVWSKADDAAIAGAVRDLTALQQEDGGWSQLAALPPDAYATGMALFALSQARIPSTAAAYQSGLKYLLSTQAPDGTWHVRTRAIPIQPYFQSGYPYEHDQWISAAGAAYATLAIVSAIDPTERGK
jgi:ankyrin repeat protein